MIHGRKRRNLSPVLSDEPLVGQGIKRRVRVVLIAVATAFLLTNITSHLIGQAVRADADRDARTRIADLERRFAADLEERRKQRDAEVARQDAELRELRRDACTLVDRIQPRDAEVMRMRRRYGCTASPTSPSTPSRQVPAVPRGNATGNPEAGREQGEGNPPRPAPPPPAPPDDGLVCLPVIGCPI